jgi:lysophospholipase L1-like esterase
MVYITDQRLRPLLGSPCVKAKAQCEAVEMSVNAKLFREKADNHSGSHNSILDLIVKSTRLAFLRLVPIGLLAFVVPLVVVFGGCSGQSVQQEPGVRYASDIEAFLQQDLANPPPKEGILFIGSSIFRQWAHLSEQMAPLPVFNRAFGGSTTADILNHMDKVVLPYKPRVIVYYCGSNDINGGERSTVIFGRTRAFCERVHAELSDTRILYVSINRAPQKQNRWDVVDSTNALMKQYCSTAGYLGYIDVNPVLFDREGKPRTDLYQSDLLHFKDQAYVEFTAVIKPVVEQVWFKR